MVASVSFLRTFGLSAACVVASVHATWLRGLEATVSDDLTSHPNWFIAAEASDYNNGIVANFLANVSNTRAEGEAYATFDWDNTCVFGDISYTSVFYQVDNLNFRLTPEQFESHFALGYNTSSSDECLPEGLNTVLANDVNGSGITFADVLNSTVQDYKVLYNAYIGPTYNLTSGNASLTLEEIKETTEYNNFAAKFGFMTNGVVSVAPDAFLDCAMRLALTVRPQTLVGMTEQDINEMMTGSLRWNLNAKIDTPSYTSTGDLQVKGSYQTGLRVFNGQETTMRALRAAGVEVYIVSASPVPIVQVVAQLTGLTYAVPDSNIYAMRFTWDEENKFAGQLVDGYPIVWGPGKATVIEEYLVPLHNNQPPVYASGDSDGDCAMLETVRDGIVHVNNRLHTTCIQEFYELACTYFNTTDPSTNNHYLLQGQDKIIGSWIPSGYTTTNGTVYTAGTAEACAELKFLSV